MKALNDDPRGYDDARLNPKKYAAYSIKRSSTSVHFIIDLGSSSTTATFSVYAYIGGSWAYVEDFTVSGSGKIVYSPDHRYPPATYFALQQTSPAPGGTPLEQAGFEYVLVEGTGE